MGGDRRDEGYQTSGTQRTRACSFRPSSPVDDHDGAWEEEAALIHSLTEWKMEVIGTE